MFGQLFLAGLLLFACTPLFGPPLPHIDHFRQIPESAKGDWLHGQQLVLEPFVSGSIHTALTLDGLPSQFHAQFPDARSYRPLWARERDAAVFLHGEVSGAVARRLHARSSPVLLLPGPGPAKLRHHYHASGNLDLGDFRPVLFDRRADRLGDTSTGSDRFAPFRKAFLAARTSPPNNALRLVTGYLGLHCTHELVGRGNVDRVSTTVDWLMALVDANANIVAQAYVGTASEQYKCPVPSDAWETLLNSLADQLIDALLMPRLRKSALG